MRLIKMFGLAVAAAAIVMAFVGATSAMAITELEEVVVCTLKEEPCKLLTGDHFQGQIDGVLKEKTEATLVSSLGTVKCNESTTGGATTELLAHGEITSVTFNSNGGPCKLGETNCKVTDEGKPYLVLVLLANDHVKYHAVVSKKGEKGLEPKALVDCGSSALKCKFFAAEILFEVLLEANDTVWDVHQELKREGGSGFLCPTTSTWNAEYLVRCLAANHIDYIPCWPKMES